MHTYVVMDYDCVVYAGGNRKDAIKSVKGNGCVQVWVKGVWQYDLVYKFGQKTCVKR